MRASTLFMQKIKCTPHYPIIYNFYHNHKLYHQECNRYFLAHSFDKPRNRLSTSHQIISDLLNIPTSSAS